MRALGVDHGSVRIGLALSDPGGVVAMPFETVVGEEAALTRIVELVGERGVQEVVVGLPRNMDGSLGPQAESATRFAERLTIRLGNVPVQLWDERLTSAQADQALARGDRRAAKPHRKGGARDRVAACLLLQSYLDCRRRGSHQNPD